TSAMFQCDELCVKKDFRLPLASLLTWCGAWHSNTRSRCISDRSPGSSAPQRPKKSPGLRSRYRRLSDAVERGSNSVLRCAHRVSGFSNLPWRGVEFDPTALSNFLLLPIAQDSGKKWGGKGVGQIRSLLPERVHQPVKYVRSSLNYTDLQVHAPIAATPVPAL